MWTLKQLASGGAALMSGNSLLTAMTIARDGSVAFPAGTDMGIKYADVALTAAQIKALNATPRSLVAAPGANLANIFMGAVFFLDYGTAAYAGIAAGEDLSVKYTDASGIELAQCETTGFLDAVADSTRYVRPHAAASGNDAITPVANAAIVLHMLSGEIITGDSPLRVRTYYRTIPTVL